MLEESVRSFLDCQTDGIDHELLIIDNNSTDTTREIAELFAKQNPRIRYGFEPLQNLCHARNRGILESRGEIVAFVDDDVKFSSGWLTALASAFERHVDVACVGGKVVPHFEADRPSWLDDDLSWIYGVTRYGDHEREIQPPETPIGCNMAFRRVVFEQIGCFHPSLGRRGENLQSNDENRLFISVAKAGLKTLYSPDVLLAHRIPPARTSRNWVERRFYWQGISNVVLRQIDDDPLSRVILTRKAIKTFFGLLRRWKDTAGLLSTKNGRNGGAFKKQLEIYYKLGELRQVIAELLSVPAGNVANSGRRVRDK
jgi:glycosyltransferase involved in cell wall biosynthesis